MEREVESQGYAGCYSKAEKSEVTSARYVYEITYTLLCFTISVEKLIDLCCVDVWLQSERPGVMAGGTFILTRP